MSEVTLVRACYVGVKCCNEVKNIGLHRFCIEKKIPSYL